MQTTTTTPRTITRHEAYALITAEAQMLEDYRQQLQSELSSVGERIRVLHVRYAPGAQQPLLDANTLWG